jgi:hypothetical protein
MVNIINLTPHTINIISSNAPLSIPSTGLARVAVTNYVTGDVNGITLYGQQYGEVEGLPEPAEDTLYVVSAIVRAAVPDRLDVASPGELVRNEAGQPIGCRGLVVN